MEIEMDIRIDKHMALDGWYHLSCRGEFDTYDKFCSCCNTVLRFSETFCLTLEDTFCINTFYKRLENKNPLKLDGRKYNSSFIEDQIIKKIESLMLRDIPLDEINKMKIKVDLGDIEEEL